MILGVRRHITRYEFMLMDSFSNPKRKSFSCMYLLSGYRCNSRRALAGQDTRPLLPHCRWGHMPCYMVLR